MKPKKFYVVKDVLPIDNGSMLELIAVNYDTAKAIYPEIKQYFTIKERLDKTAKHTDEIKAIDNSETYDTCNKAFKMTFALQELNSAILKQKQANIEERIQSSPKTESKWYIPNNNIQQYQMFKDIPTNAMSVPYEFNLNAK